MSLPDVMKCYNGLKVDRIEGMCIFLKCFAYPCRYLDMIPRFARPVPLLCMVSNAVMDYIYTYTVDLFAVNFQSTMVVC